MSDHTDGQGQDLNNQDDQSNQNSNATKTFTQEEVNQILEQRLARERKRFEKQTDQQGFVLLEKDPLRNF